MSEKERIQLEFASALAAGHGVIEIGDTVLCDCCSLDLTNDPRSGGFLFGSYGYGPCCAERMMGYIVAADEEDYIKARCPESVPFAMWIRDVRGPNPQITVS